MLTLINRTGKYFIKYLIEQLKLEMAWNFNGKKMSHGAEWLRNGIFRSIFLNYSFLYFKIMYLPSGVYLALGHKLEIKGCKREKECSRQQRNTGLSNQVYKFSSFSVSLSAPLFPSPSLPLSHSVSCFISHFYVHTLLGRLGVVFIR